MGAKEYESVRKEKDRLRQEMTILGKALPKLLRPLSGLSDEQTIGLRIYTMLLSISSITRRPQFLEVKDLLRGFYIALEEVCPEFESYFPSSDPCFDSSVAYVSALSKCEEEG